MINQMQQRGMSRGGGAALMGLQKENVSDANQMLGRNMQGQNPMMSSLQLPPTNTNGNMMVSPSRMAGGGPSMRPPGSSYGGTALRGD
jgi:hypothetical protein